MDIFCEDDYRKIIYFYLKSKPNNGYGQLSKLANKLNVNATLISQILKGNKNFTEDQIVGCGEFLNLNLRESYYLLLLLQKERAASQGLKKLLQKQIEHLQKEARLVAGRISSKKVLSIEDQSIYYSHWIYSTLHTAISIKKNQSLATLIRTLPWVNSDFIKKSLEHLLAMGLIAEDKGQFRQEIVSTYLPPDSPFIFNHHRNWSEVAIQSMSALPKENFFFTAPFSISHKHFDSFRKELINLTTKLYKVVDETEPEELACLRIEYFKPHFTK